MVLRTATKDENVPRPRTLIMELLAMEAELRWIEDTAAAKSWIMHHS
jgi:hypothetical protein